MVDATSARQWLPGLLVTLLAIVAVEISTRTPYAVPSLAPVLLGVAYAAYSGGVRGGLVSASALTAHAFVFFLSGDLPASLNDDLVRRAVASSLTAFSMAVLVGTLRLRADRASARVLERERAHRVDLEDASRALERANRTLSVTNRALTDSNRALEAFSHSVAHDLRAPLRGVETLTRFTLEDHGDKLPADGRQQLESVVQSAQRMRRLVDDILHFAQSGSVDLRVERLDVCALAADVVHEVRERHPGRDVRFSCPSSGHAPVVDADSRLVRVVLTNLLDNAWKFTRDATPEARVDVGVADAVGEDGYVVFFVRDNGAGFPADAAEAVFREFERVHHERRFAGTGIGLAIVRRVIERHGGRVWAEGREGEGATFYFALPGGPDLEAQGSRAHDRADARPSGSAWTAPVTRRLAPRPGGGNE